MWSQGYLQLYLEKENTTLGKEIWSKNEKEGLKVISPECISGTMKTNWLRSFLRNVNSSWFHIPDQIVMILEEINFLV